MTILKTFVLNKFNTLFTIFACVLLSIFLLSIRLKITQSFFYIFLVWNLFLAAVPFLVSSFLSTIQKVKKWKLFSILIVWLLFLPNAPYILTDFIHLRLSEPNWLGFDAIMIGMFAFSGLILYFLSLSDIKKLLLNNFSKKMTSVILYTIPFLTGFGIYLGRFLRWNSWDILQSPQNLFLDILSIVFHPIENIQVWLFTVLFGAFLLIGFWIYENMQKKISKY